MKEEKKAKAKSSYTEKEMTITEKFRDINIQVADDMDVKLVESDDDKCYITYFDSPDVVHSVTVQDDALVMTCAGAYGMTMGSNYNTRPRAAEVLVDGGKVSLIRERETVGELFKAETIPAF